ncbi:MAG: GTP-binding protein [Rhodobacteraceae bacterium]|nr:MAG: GTP-binding protein [Paracoccaceae bacterium]
MSALDYLPVTVIGGYLGAGKTTLVNYLLRNANGLRLAVLVNEFGELAIDRDLIEAEEEGLISISGGCVCCSFGGDLIAALRNLSQMQPRPQHILIESSGVAKPSAIFDSVALLDGFSADGVVVLSDAETVQENANDKYMGDTVLAQITQADILLLNKCDLVDPQDIAETANWLARQNPNARLVKTKHSVAAPEVVLESFLGRQKITEPHHHLDQMTSMNLIPTTSLDAMNLAKTLAEGEFGLVRAKGFVTDISGDKMLIQIVGRRWAIKAADPKLKDGLVCLGMKEQMRPSQLRALIA